MKVLVTGGSGMLGCHIRDKIWTTAHEGIFVGSNDYDLTSQFQVRKMFEETMADYCGSKYAVSVSNGNYKNFFNNTKNVEQVA